MLGALTLHLENTFKPIVSELLCQCGELQRVGKIPVALPKARQGPGPRDRLADPVLPSPDPHTGEVCVTDQRPAP